MSRLFRLRQVCAVFTLIALFGTTPIRGSSVADQRIKFGYLRVKPLVGWDRRISRVRDNSSLSFGRTFDGSRVTLTIQRMVLPFIPDSVSFPLRIDPEETRRMLDSIGEKVLRISDKKATFHGFRAYETDMLSSARGKTYHTRRLDFRKRREDFAVTVLISGKKLSPKAVRVADGLWKQKRDFVILDGQSVEPR